jgi:hypothetical protein
MDLATALAHAREAGRGSLTDLHRLLEAVAQGNLPPTEFLAGLGITSTPTELNDSDLSAKSQAITVAGAISIDARYVAITGPASSTYAVTLAAPARAGQVLVIEMVATTSTNAVTLALTNVIGGTAATTATFNAARETLVLVSAGDRWVVLAEAGVTLS